MRMSEWADKLDAAEDGKEFGEVINKLMSFLTTVKDKDESD